MSLNVAKAQLLDAAKQLRSRWARIQQDWDDDTRRRFEAEFVNPIEAKVLLALKGVDYVSELEARARRDCGDDV